MKTVTIFLAMGLLLAAAWAQPAGTRQPTSAAVTEPATAASEPTTTATTEPTTSTSQPTTVATTEPTTSTSQSATAATTEPATAPSESPVATTPATRPAVANAPTTRPAATFDDYRIVFERNIFLKDRMPKPQWHPFVPRPVASQPAPHGLVLTGVAIRQEVRLAFFEDDQTGQLTKAVVGDVLGGGKLASISLDGVEISKGGKTRKIAIGESLAGAGTVDMSSVRPPVTTAGPADSPSSGGDDILERMKKRRAKELKP